RFSRMLKKVGWGSWDDPRARATRGLRRMGRERPGALLARRTRTMKLCSFDARSEGQSGCSPDGEVGKTRRPSPWQMARPGKSIAKQSEGRAGEKYLPVGGRVRTLRAVGIILDTPYEVTARCGLAWDKARPRAKNLSWQTQGGRVK